MITPFEFELACRRDLEWTGEYETDITRVLPRLRKDIAAAADAAADNDTDKEPVFSLVHGGGYISHSVTAEENSARDGDGAGATLAVRNNITTIAARPAAQFLAARSYGGLETNVGDRPAMLAEEGRSGLAAGYTHEP